MLLLQSDTHFQGIDYARITVKHVFSFWGIGHYSSRTVLITRLSVTAYSSGSTFGFGVTDSLFKENSIPVFSSNHIVFMNYCVKKNQKI